MSKTYAVELTSDNFAQVTDYLLEKSDLFVSELKITDHVILIQDVGRRTRSWQVLTPAEFAQKWEYNNQCSYLYFRGIRGI